MKALNKKVKVYHNDDWDIFHDDLFLDFRHVSDVEETSVIFIEKSELNTIEKLIKLYEGDDNKQISKYVKILETIKKDLKNGVDIIIIETY